MALDKVKQGVIADDAVGSSQIAPDTVVAADIGANAITASELADNAVDTAAIASNAVTTAKITDANITTAKVANSAITSLKLGDVIDTVPHIIPGVLYPSYVASGTANKLLDGTTNHSGAFGTEQSDGRKYYYTNIAGSKPIKDPRIGAYFGSQRHKFKSLQLLEQETGVHGKNVYSIDGREWVRAVDVTSGAFAESDLDIGISLNVATDKEGWIEVVGYFNAVNLIMRVQPNKKSLTPYINGTAGSAQTPQEATVATPLDGRYVDGGSVVSLTLPSTTLGINTLLIKDNIESSHSTNYHYGIELIAHDTSNVNEIKIPKQNVVSYGKKFEVGSDDLTHAIHPHYNPFAIAGDGSTAVAIGDSGSHGKVVTGWAGASSAYFDSTLDVDTSLGLDAWVDSGNYYRPVNGGRIVKWVDSSGNIKTSVNMMPPSAKAIGSHSGNSGPHQTAWTSTYQPVFSSGSIDNSQAEVATSVLAREFGNGSANDNGNYADVSTLTADDDVAYVLDDGLTGMAGALAYDTYESVKPHSTDSQHYVTFIGTGLTLRQVGNTHAGIQAIAQNLPFGTHVLSAIRNSTPNNTPYKLDGVQLLTGFLDIAEVTIHQPKRPPIPEDAVILSDYMLMADYVPRTATGDGANISKGIRRVVARDIWYDSPNAWVNAFYADANYGPTGFRAYTSDSGAGNIKVKLPAFADKFEIGTFDARHDLFVGGSAVAHADVSSGTKAFVRQTGTKTLANQIFEGRNNASNNGNSSYFDIATPIHTSHHYQTFETSLFNELIGGDRNMEQTNLVCTSDGKTWDELTRDTSYIGNLSFMAARTAVMNHSSNILYHELFRGSHNNENNRHYHNKDFAIARNNLYICLRTGVYTLNRTLRHNGYSGGWKVNDNYVVDADCADEDTTIAQVTVPLKRGDYVWVTGGNAANSTNHNFTIILRAD